MTALAFRIARPFLGPSSRRLQIGRGKRLGGRAAPTVDEDLAFADLGPRQAISDVAAEPGYEPVDRFVVRGLPLDHATGGRDFCPSRL